MKLLIIIKINTVAMLSITSFLLLAVTGLASTFPLDEDIQNMLFDMGYIDLSQYGRSIFGDPDNSTGDLIANYDPATNGQNPEELGSYLEGDILMPLGQARNGLTASGARWPNAIIPYEIRGDFGELLTGKFKLITANQTILFFRCFPNEYDRNGIHRISHKNLHPI